MVPYKIRVLLLSLSLAFIKVVCEQFAWLCGSCSPFCQQCLRCCSCVLVVVNLPNHASCKSCSQRQQTRKFGSSIKARVRTRLIVVVVVAQISVLAAAGACSPPLEHYLSLLLTPCWFAVNCKTYQLIFCPTEVSVLLHQKPLFLER
jgi:hypothetical protein